MQKDSKAKTKSKELKYKILYSIVAVILAVGVFFAGFFIRPLCYDETTKDIFEIIRLTKENYDGEFEYSDSSYGKNFADTFLDDYSDFYSEEEYRLILEQGRGKNLGIGVSFLRSEKTAKIYSVEGNSPAFKAGMVKGETIVGAERSGVQYTFSEKDEVLDFITSVGEGVEVTLKTQIQDGGEIKSYQVIKSKYEKNYVYYFDSEYKYYFEKEYGASDWVAKSVINNGEDGITNLPEDVGYIYFSSFEGDLEKQIEKAFEIFKARGKKKLILDLRDNGGGYIETLFNVTTYFVDTEKNPLVAIAKYKDGSQVDYYARGKKFYSGIEDIAVIANPNSASATECLIGAMLYYGAIDLSDLIIQKNQSGKSTTYGKGIMQSHFYLTSGSVLKLTVAHVYQPDGTTCIQGTGISTTENNVAETATIALQKAINALN